VADCWTYTGHRQANGYGTVGIEQGVTRYVHRVVWEALVSPIPDGKVIDHLCRNRACCNPDHMRVTDTRGNVLAGYSAAAFAARRSHCAKGHEYTEANTRITTKGTRQCRACHREFQRVYDNRKKVSA
jgi:hypothetical protein